MREIGNTIVQLFAIIMILVTLAVSTAAVSQWASGDTNESQASAQTEVLLASGTR
jgi:hypothetical protein